MALYKLSTPRMLEESKISRTIRQHSAKIVEVNETYSVVTLTGLPEDIDSLFASLESFGCVLQFVRCGAIAVTKNRRELLDEYLETLGVNH